MISVVFFDWDDTLFPSTWLRRKGYTLEHSSVVSDDDKKLLGELCGVVKQCLEKVWELASNRVYVITNAEKGWVEQSVCKFMPDLVSMVAKIKVISARTEFQDKFPEQPPKWKYEAMYREIISLLLQPQPDDSKTAYPILNLMSFGDSLIEREAFLNLDKQLKISFTTRSKTIKLKDTPCVEHLRKQVALVNECLKFLHDHTKDLDLQMSVKDSN